MLEKRLLIGIPGAGGRSNDFDITKPHLTKLGYDTSFPSFYEEGSPEEILENMKCLDYEHYFNILKTEIVMGLNNNYDSINILTHSFGASIALNYLLRSKKLPRELKKITCMAPAITYFDFDFLPLVARVPFEKFTSISHRICKSFPSIGNKKLDFLGIEDIKLLTFLSYLNHGFKISNKSEFKVPIDFLFPEFDEMMDCEESTNQERTRYLLRKYLIKPENQIRLSNYDDDTHNGWYDKFPLIFPNNI